VYVEPSVADHLNAAATALALATKGLESMPVASGELAVTTRAIVDQIDMVCTRIIAKLDPVACRDEGYPNAPAWVDAHTNTRPGEANARIRVADVLDKLPLWSAAADEGVVGVAQVQLLASVMTRKRLLLAQRDEAMLLEYAQTFRFTDFRKIVKHWVAVHDDTVTAPEADDEELDERRVQLAELQNGMWHLDGLLDSITGGTLAAALESAMPKPCEGDNRTVTQRRHDALGDVAFESLSGEDRPDIGGERTHVTMIIDAATGLAYTRHMNYVSTVTRDMLLCDCIMTVVHIKPTGEPFEVGTPTSSIPKKNRRAVQTRDECCRFPGCNRPVRWTDIHHIRYRDDGGTHEIRNLVSLCRFHHRYAHRKGLRLYWDADGVTLMVEWPNGIVKHDPPIPHTFRR
jgi:Domain of unknown function (DUF222)/HNH endonuclease